MYTPYFTVTAKLLKNIEDIAQAIGFLRAVEIPIAYRQAYQEKITAETVHSSTAIEGNTLTQAQVQSIIQGKEVVGLPNDIQEAKNYYQVLQFIHEVAQHTDAFNQQTILELHQKLLVGVKNDIAGKYRTTQVRVGDYFPPESWQVPHLMADFVSWLNTPVPQGFSPIIYAGILHYQLVAIHPFEDGNGRTTRALVTLFLMKKGYDITHSFSLENYYNNERRAYYNALSTADRMRTEEGLPDLTSWLEYFSTGFLIEAQRAQAQVLELMKKERVDLGISLNHTQRTILEITAQKGIAQMADYLQQLSITQKGAYNSLQKLIELELISQSGEKRGTQYSITQKGLEYFRVF